MTAPPLPLSRDSESTSEVVATPAGEPAYHAVHDLAALAAMLLRHLRSAAVDEAGPAGRRALLDAFLCAAGMWQVVDDHVRRDVADLGRIAKYAGRLPGPAGRLAAVCLRGAAATVRRWRWRVSEAALVRLAGDLAQLSQDLASQLACGGDSFRRSGLLGSAEAVAAEVARAPARLRRTVAIPPRCFFSFDQRPEDCERLAAGAAERWPDRGVPLAVVGVRTSGSYLAPLVAAHLRLAGFRRVTVLSWRPGQATLRPERQAVAALAAAGGRALLVDDPPTSGGSLARVAADLQRLGLRRASVAFLLQVFDSPGWWEWERRLAGRETVLLPFARWAIRDRLREPAVRDDLATLLTGRTVRVAGNDRMGPSVRVRDVLGVERLPDAWTVDLRAEPQTGRGHVRAIFRARLVDADGGAHDHHVLARGSGLGLFGDQAAAAGRRLEGLVPETYGARDGVLYRAWLPEALRAGTSVPAERLAAAAAAYVAGRRSALPVDRDLAAELAGHDTVWEACSRWAGAAYGRLALALRPVLHRVSRRLLALEAASLVDGGLREADWFLAGSPDGTAALVKTGFEERVFRYQVPLSYDPVYDLATAVVEHDDPGFGDLLRREYRRLTGEEVAEERWFLYRLLALKERRDLHVANYAAYLRHPDRGSDGVVAPSRYALVHALTEGERALSRVHERYLGDAYLGDLEPPETGPLCAVDVDGVLETAWLSYPAVTPAGTLALRALARHGYRAVLATGRSLQEVRERCAAYRLAGGVAEYGAAAYDHRAGRAVVLLDEAQRADLDRVRRELAREPDVVVDQRYRAGVRAWRIAGVRTRSLEPGQAAEALRRAGTEGRVRTIHGWAQTDFVAAGVGKGTGLRALAELLGEPAEGTFLALAVGDTLPDLAMFAHARLAAAPANVAPEVRAVMEGLVVLGRPYQAGLLQAVERLLGHRAAGCRVCAPPPQPADRRLLLAMLAGADRGRAGKVLQGLALASRVGRP